MPASERQKRAAMKAAMQALSLAHCQLICIGKHLDRLHPRIARRPECQWVRSLEMIQDALAALRFAMGEEKPELDHGREN